MATLTGKKARKQIGGNRHTLKRTKKRGKLEKIFTNNKCTPETYWRTKKANKAA